MSLDLELELVVSHTAWVLATELNSCAEAVSAINGAVSPVVISIVL